jgi:hypothetical protein
MFRERGDQGSRWSEMGQIGLGQTLCKDDFGLFHIDLIQILAKIG